MDPMNLCLMGNEYNLCHIVTNINPKPDKYPFQKKKLYIKITKGFKCGSINKISIQLNVFLQ